MPKILVVGDLMLDHYIYGTCDRISPEAPVQIVLKQNESKRLGGCGNVISNLIALKAEVGLISVLGDDEIGREILSLLKEKGVKDELILQERGRKSSQKSRILVSHQQVLRIDSEHIQDIKLENEIIVKFKEILSRYDIVLLSDYGKGVLTNKLTKSLIKQTKEQNKMILIDPKGSDYSKYNGATLLTPNKKETSIALKKHIKNNDDIKNAALELKQKFNLTFSLITLSEQGICLYDNEFYIFDALAKEVFDVTGAGDSVLATLGYTLANGNDIQTAIKFANLAAAVVVGKLGSADATWEEINLLAKQNHKKIISQQEFSKLALNGKKIIFTNGCFDILHSGHISYLEQAKSLGDILVVGLNSDDSVKRLKGELRPINNQNDRAKILQALECVDFVIIFDEDTPENLIKSILPDVLVKGADYTNKNIAGAKYAKEVKLLDFIQGKSSTNIINKIKTLN